MQTGVLQGTQGTKGGESLIMVIWQNGENLSKLDSSDIWFFPLSIIRWMVETPASEDRLIR